MAEFTPEDFANMVAGSAVPTTREFSVEQFSKFMGDYKKNQELEQKTQEELAKQPSVPQRALEGATFQIGPFDTGVELDPRHAAMMAGAGASLTNAYQGVKQKLATTFGLKQAAKEITENVDLMGQLHADPVYGAYTTAGSLYGSFFEPAGLVFAAGKVRSVADFVKWGALAGATLKAASPSGSQDPGAIVKAFEGLVEGGVVGGALGTITKGVVDGINKLRGIRGDSAIPWTNSAERESVFQKMRGMFGMSDEELGKVFETYEGEYIPREPSKASEQPKGNTDPWAQRVETSRPALTGPQKRLGFNGEGGSDEGMGGSPTPIAPDPLPPFPGTISREAFLRRAGFPEATAEPVAAPASIEPAAEQSTPLLPAPTRPSPVIPDSALGPLLRPLRYTTEVLERLPKNRTEFPVSMIWQELARDDVSDHEREIFRYLLRNHSGNTVSARELVDGFRLYTGDLALHPEVVSNTSTEGTYSNYGLYRVDVDTTAHPGTTTFWLSELQTIPDPHFPSRDNLLGWSRSFERDGIQHVVEMQLNRHIEGKIDRVAQDVDSSIHHARSSIRIHESRLANIENFIQRTRSMTAQEIRDVLVSDYSQQGQIQDAINVAVSRAYRAGEITGARYDEFISLANDRSNLDILKGRVLARFKRLVKELPDIEKGAIRESTAVLEKAVKRQAELETIIANRDILAPVTSNYMRKFVRHIFAANPEAAKIRFSTPETTAKVEGWPKDTPQELEASKQLIHQYKEDLRRRPDGMSPEGYEAYRVTLEKELPKEELRVSRSERGWPSKPEHQSLYNKYVQMEGFYKKMGGKEVTDEQGHTWWEVPRPEGQRIKQFGFANVNLLSSIAGGGLGAILNPDHPLEGAMFGAALGYLASKGIGSALQIRFFKSARMGRLGQEYWQPPASVLAQPRNLAQALRWSQLAAEADTMLLWQHVKAARKAGVTPVMARKFRDFSEGSMVSMSPAERQLYNRWVKPLREVIADQMNKLRSPNTVPITDADITTRLATNHRAWWDNIADSPDARRVGGLAQRPGSMRPRVAYALQNGTIITIKENSGGGYRVVAWRNQVPTLLGNSPKRLGAGDSFHNLRIVEARQRDIEMHTPITYVEDDLAVHAARAAEWMRYTRNQEFLNELVNSPQGRRVMLRETDTRIPDSYRKLHSAEMVPQFRGIYMPEHIAEVLDDFIARYHGTPGMWEGINNIVIRAFMIIPVPHIANELVHWWGARGISGFITPRGMSGANAGLSGLAKTFPVAVRSVLLQDEIQVLLMKNGMNMLAPRVRNAMAWADIFEIGLGNVLANKNFVEVAKILGKKPVELLTKVSDFSQAVMWTARDIMATQLVLEQSMMGHGIQEAIREVERHMPGYYIPNRVGTQGKLGRIASKIMQLPIFVFSPYHYGMTHSLKEIAREAVNIRNSAEMRRGIDHLLMLAVGLWAIYPMFDKILQATFGRQDLNVKARRAGPLHAMDTAVEIAHGEKDYPSLLMGFLTPSPAIVVGMEAMSNRNLFDGSTIIYPGTTYQQKAFDAARYVGSKLSPIQGAQRVQEGRATAEEVAFRWFDVIAQTPESEERKRKFREFLRMKGRKHGERMNKLYDMDLPPSED